MFKDYYSILGVGFSATQDEIKSAYRQQALKWHPDRNPGINTEEEMKDVNEAYSILYDITTRKRYDDEYIKFKSYYSATHSSDSAKYTQRPSSDGSRYDTNRHRYDYDIKDNDLKNDIHKAQKKAEDFVREFYENLKSDAQKAAKGAWNGAKPFLIIALISLGISFFVAVCSSASNSDTTEDYLESFSLSESISVPETWTQYTVGNVCTISVPPTVELQMPEDEYSKTLKSNGFQLQRNGMIFQQKGLSSAQKQYLSKYCRILVSVTRGSYGDYLSRKQTVPLDYEWQSVIEELVKTTIGNNAKLDSKISYRWQDVNGANALVIDYIRTGNNFDKSIPVSSRIVIFQDNDKMVNITLAYRSSEAPEWKADFDKVYKTFKWL